MNQESKWIRILSTWVTVLCSSSDTLSVSETLLALFAKSPITIDAHRATINHERGGNEEGTLVIRGLCGHAATPRHLSVHHYKVYTMDAASACAGGIGVSSQKLGVDGSIYLTY